MKTKLNKQIILLVLATIAIPTFLFFGASRVINQTSRAWQYVVDICVSHWGLIINYLSHPGNLLILAVIIVFALALGRGTVFLVSQIINNRRLEKEFAYKLLPEMNVFKGQAEARVIKDEQPIAVTVGFIKPIIYVSTGLINRLTALELRSVIAHERHHQSRKHPLCLLLANALKSFLFFLPITRDLAEYLRLKHEIAADRAAIGVASRQYLLSALLKIFQTGVVARQFKEPVSTLALSKDRIAALLAVETRNRFKLSKAFVALSLLSLLLIGLVLFRPQSSYAHNQVGTNILNVNLNYCHRPNQSLGSIIGFDQLKLYMTPNINN